MSTVAVAPPMPPCDGRGLSHALHLRGFRVDLTAITFAELPYVVAIADTGYLGCAARRARPTTVGERIGARRIVLDRNGAEAA